MDGSVPPTFPFRTVVPPRACDAFVPFACALLPRRAAAAWRTFALVPAYL